MSITERPARLGRRFLAGHLRQEQLPWAYLGRLAAESSHILSEEERRCRNPRWLSKNRQDGQV